MAIARSVAGKIALTAAGLFVGALFAVYGQIYQTGADSYQLFLTWALLISGWVLISKFAPLWFIWIVLLNLSAIFYYQQIIGTVNGLLYLALFLLNGGALLCWEVFKRVGVSWLQSRWTPRLLSLFIFTSLVAPTLTLIFVSQYATTSDPWLPVMAILFVVISALTLYFYSQKILDQFILIVCAFSLIITLIAGLLRAGNFQTGVILLAGALVIGLAALVVTWLNHLSKDWEARKI